LRDYEGSVVFVSPDLRPGVEAILKGLDEQGLLNQFVTTLGLVPSGRVDRLLQILPSQLESGLRRIVSRRQLPVDMIARTQTYPFRELIRTSFRRSVGNEIVGDYLWWWAERGFDRAVARHWAGVSPVVYGFELASAETFRAQKQAGGWCVLGQLIAHHRTAYALMREELERFPGAATDYTQRGLDTAARVNALKDEQYAHSDLIVANSAYVKATFIEAGIPESKLVVVPGAAPDLSCASSARREHPVGKTIFLSVGAQSVRKGTPYLLDAWRKLRPTSVVELWMAGRMVLPPALLKNLPGHVDMLGTLPHSQLYKRYGEASVLVLPSLCEGFALVILEAMAHGLPIITTPNSGCGDFVEDGVNGWIVPIRDAEALADRMAWCCDHPQELLEMGARSREKAQQWTWRDYERVHTETILTFLESLAA
jgi:glycosyltransferase involved in cell wall biosynthesis